MRVYTITRTLYVIDGVITAGLPDVSIKRSYQDHINQARLGAAGAHPRVSASARFRVVAKIEAQVRNLGT